MLWHKAWLDTRWRFLIGLAVLSIMAVGIIRDYRLTNALLPSLKFDTTTTEGRMLQEALLIQRTYRGFVWMQWFRANLTTMGTLFAVVLGSGGVFSSVPGGLFTLSLPASRNQWLSTRAATGLGELFVLAAVPSLAIAALSPYSVVDVAVHVLCLFVATTVFFCLAFLLSTIFNDVWRPVMIVIAIACIAALFEGALKLNGLFHVMSGENYFKSGSLPWVGLVSSVALSAALLYAASANVARKDF